MGSLRWQEHLGPGIVFFSSRGLGDNSSRTGNCGLMRVLFSGHSQKENLVLELSITMIDSAVIAQPLRALAVLPKDPVQFPAQGNCVAAHTVTPVPGDLAFSSPP